MTSGNRRRARARQRGMGYLLVLFALAALGFSLAGAGEVQHTLSLRDKETQLLFVGQQFRRALASYRDRSPAGTPVAPATLDDLLEDRRFVQPVRHLRRLWVDPMTNDTRWSLLVADGRIVGIYSRSEREPLRTAFATRDASFAGLASYQQWVFTADPPPRPAIPLSPVAGTTP